MKKRGLLLVIWIVVLFLAGLGFLAYSQYTGNVVSDSTSVCGNNICEIGEESCRQDCINLVDNPNFDEGLEGWKSYGYAKPKIINGKLFLENNASGQPGVYQNISFPTPISSSFVVSYNLNVSQLSSNAVASLDLGVYYDDGTREFFYKPIMALSSDLNKEIKKTAVFTPKAGKNISHVTVSLLAYYAPASISFDNVFVALQNLCNKNAICDAGENVNNCPTDCISQEGSSTSGNLITNPGFEEIYSEKAMPASWVNVYSKDLSISKSAHTGQNSLLLKNDVVQSAGPIVWSSDYIEVDSSVSYTLSSWVKGVSGTPRVFLGLRYFNSTFAQAKYSDTGVSYSYPAVRNVASPDSWTVYSGSIQGVSSVHSDNKFPVGTRYVKIYATILGSSLGEVSFDDLSFSGATPKLEFIELERDVPQTLSQNSKFYFFAKCLSGSCGDVKVSIAELASEEYNCGQMDAGEVCTPEFVVGQVSAGKHDLTIKGYSNEVSETKILSRINFVNAGCGNNICESIETPSSCSSDCSYHPLLYFNSSELQKIKRVSQTQNILGFTPAESLNTILSTADSYVAENYKYQDLKLINRTNGRPFPYTYVLSGQTPLRASTSELCCPWTGFGWELGSRLEYLSFAYAMTGDEKYFNKARVIMNSINQWDYWEEQYLPSLSTASLGRGFSFAYDVFYDKLTEAEKNKIRVSLLTHVIVPIDAHLADNWTKMNDNSHATFISALGISSLAIMHEEDTSVYLNNALGYLDKHFLLQDQSGGMYEGAVYGAYSVRQIMWFMDGLKRNTPNDYFSKPFMQNVWKYFLSMSHSGKLANLNDANDGINWFRDFAYFAGTLKVSEASWFLAKSGYKFNEPFPFMHIPETVSVKSPDFGSSFFQPSGLASLRSSWVDNSSALFFTTGYDKNQNFPPYSHYQFDKNTFIIIKNGKWYVSDAGYFHPETYKHTNILVEGAGQNQKYAGNMTDFYSTPVFDYATGEASSAYVFLSSSLMPYGEGQSSITPEGKLRIEGAGDNSGAYQIVNFEQATLDSISVSYQVKASAGVSDSALQTMAIRLVYTDGTSAWHYKPLIPSSSERGRWTYKSLTITPKKPVSSFGIYLVNSKTNSPVEFDSIHITRSPNTNIAMEFPYKKIDSFERTVFLIKPDIFVISDSLRGTGIAEYSWLMQSNGSLSWLGDKFSISFPGQQSAYGAVISDKQLTRKINSVLYSRSSIAVSDIVNSTYLNVTFAGPNANLVSVINFVGDISTTGNSVSLQNGLVIVRNGTSGAVECDGMFCAVGNSSWFIVHQGRGLSFNGQNIFSSDKGILFSRTDNKVYVSANDNTNLLFYSAGRLSSGIESHNSLGGVISLNLAKGKYEFDLSSN